MTPRRFGLHARAYRSTIVLGSLMALAVTVSGCGGPDRNHDADPFNDDPEIKGTVKLAERPAMEKVLTQDRQFQTDLFRQLEQRFGPRTWKTINGEDEIDGAGCGTNLPVKWGVAGLPDMTFDGTYPPVVWHQVRDLVIEIGTRHGFTQIQTMVDRPGALYFFGRDPRYGGHYEFGMGKNTVLGIDTGCHRWNVLPTPPSPGP